MYGSLIVIGFGKVIRLCANMILLCGEYEINTFIKEWLYIEDYFIYANIKQKELELEAKQKKKEYNDAKGKITYL